MFSLASQRTLMTPTELAPGLVIQGFTPPLNFIETGRHALNA